MMGGQWRKTQRCCAAGGDELVPIDNREDHHNNYIDAIRELSCDSRAVKSKVEVRLIEPLKGQVDHKKTRAAKVWPKGKSHQCLNGYFP
jgi:hypothetical protein